MLDARKQAEIEQSIAGMKEIFPPACWAIFTGFKDQGFTEAQALTLTVAWLTATLGSTR